MGTLTICRFFNLPTSEGKTWKSLSLRKRARSVSVGTQGRGGGQIHQAGVGVKYTFHIQTHVFPDTQIQIHVFPDTQIRPFSDCHIYEYDNFQIVKYDNFRIVIYKYDNFQIVKYDHFRIVKYKYVNFQIVKYKYSLSNTNFKTLIYFAILMP